MASKYTKMWEALKQDGVIFVNTRTYLVRTTIKAMISKKDADRIFSKETLPKIYIDYYVVESDGDLVKIAIYLHKVPNRRDLKERNILN